MLHVVCRGNRLRQGPLPVEQLTGIKHLFRVHNSTSFACNPGLHNKSFCFSRILRMQLFWTQKMSLILFPRFLCPVVQAWIHDATLSFSGCIKARCCLDILFCCPTPRMFPQKNQIAKRSRFVPFNDPWVLVLLECEDVVHALRGSES